MTKAQPSKREVSAPRQDSNLLTPPIPLASLTPTEIVEKVVTLSNFDEVTTFVRLPYTFFAAMAKSANRDISVLRQDTDLLMPLTHPIN